MGDLLKSALHLYKPKCQQVKADQVTICPGQTEACLRSFILPVLIENNYVGNFESTSSSDIGLSFLAQRLKNSIIADNWTQSLCLSTNQIVFYTPKKIRNVVQFSAIMLFLRRCVSPESAGMSLEMRRLAGVLVTFITALVGSSNSVWSE